MTGAQSSTNNHVTLANEDVRHVAPRLLALHALGLAA